MDLFFYREPEESKEQQEEEAPVQDYADYGAPALGALTADTWGDAQWQGDTGAPAIASAVTPGWSQEPGGYCLSAFELLNILNWISV